MAVVSGCRTEESDVRKVFPRSVSLGAENIMPHDGVIHHVEAGVAADNDFFHRNAEEIGEQFLGFRNAVEQAVVAGVGAVCSDVAIQRVQNSVDEIKLSSGRFTAGHVEFQLLVDVIFVLLLEFGLTG